MQSVSSKVHWMQSQIGFVECSQKAHQKCIKHVSKAHQESMRLSLNQKENTIH